MGSATPEKSQPQGTKGALLDETPKIVITSKGSDGVLKQAASNGGK